jgi:hypothetical protein
VMLVLFTLAGSCSRTKSEKQILIWVKPFILDAKHGLLCRLLHFPRALNCFLILPTAALLVWHEHPLPSNDRHSTFFGKAFKISLNRIEATQICREKQNGNSGDWEGHTNKAIDEQWRRMNPSKSAWLFI